MTTRLHLDITMQPDDFTCGPACLHSVYDYYGDAISLDQVITEVQSLKGGGTLAVLLGNHALRRGYRATIYTYNLHVFDPTWFTKGVSLPEKMKAQEAKKDDSNLNYQNLIIRNKNVNYYIILYYQNSYSSDVDPILRSVSFKS